MNRLLVSLLAAFDAVIVVAVGLAVVLAPATLLWVFGLGTDADWGALWPAGASAWLLGHFVPVAVSLPEDFLIRTGVAEAAGQFSLSLAPLALAAFTAIFAFRSGARAARAGAWITGIASGTVVVAVLSALVALTARTDVTRVDVATAIIAPTLVFAIPALVGAVVRAWNEGDDGLVDAVSERLPDGIQNGLDAAGRGLAICLAGFVALGSLVLAVLFLFRSGEIIALTQASHADLIGVVVLSLGALLYLPTLVVWFGSFAAGPGFAVGTGTTVAPAGTDLGVIPGIPVLGVVPATTSAWVLLLALVVVGIGAFAGWAQRGMLVGEQDAGGEPLQPRVVALAGMVLGSAAGVAILAWAAHGSLGPGQLVDVGPAAGAVALVVAIEIGIGAGITLLAPRRGSDDGAVYPSARDDASEPASAPR